MPPATVFYLEMTAPADLRPKRLADPAVAIARVDPPDPTLNRDLYAAVGRDWQWTDRLPWSSDQWAEYAARPGLETWLLTVGGERAGYVELMAADGDVEVAYFGILPAFVGRGLGGHLLTVAVERAWGRGARRVWVNTCTLDHPAALAHYQARGFRLYRTETVNDEQPAGASPAARGG